MQKNLRECARLEDDLLEIKYTNQRINNVRQTCAHLLLFNKNVALFVENHFKNRKQASRRRTISGTVLFHRSDHSQDKI